MAPALSHRCGEELIIMQTAQLTAACTSKDKCRGNRTSEDLEAKIRELANPPRPDLAERWRQLYRAEPPKGISRPLLTPAVAYGMQVKRYGGLHIKER